MNKKTYLIFFLILISALFLRLYKIHAVPPGVNRDEASIGYTAYSLLLTGRDEYGIQYPLSFQSFGDWKLPFYIYATVPFVKIFGLSELAVRLPSVIAGIGTIVLTFIFIKNLFKNVTLALIVALLVAISPWHIHLSRVESESNVAVFFIVLSIVFLLKSVTSKAWFIIPSLLFFALTYYIYAGNYIFTTLLLTGIFILYRRQLLHNKFLYPGIALFLAFFLLISYHSVFSANKTKLSGISIFSDPSIVHEKIELQRNDHENQSEIVGKLFHNKVLFATERFVQNYLNSYSPEFLFIKGGENRAHNILNFGNMYLIEAPFFLLGIVLLLLSRKKPESKLIIFWLLIAPIASSITKDAPNTNRMFSVFPALPITTGIGLYATLTYSIRHKIMKYGLVFFIFAALVNMSIYLDRYYVHFPRNEGEYWGIGYKKLLSTLTEEKYRTKKIIIAKPEHSHYIFLLFYSAYDPQIYQRIAKRYPPTNDKFVHVKGYDRFEFRDIDWSKDIKAKNTLLIDVPEDIPPIIKIKKYSRSEIILPNKRTMFTIVETK